MEDHIEEEGTRLYGRQKVKTLEKEYKTIKKDRG